MVSGGYSLCKNTASAVIGGFLFLVHLWELLANPDKAGNLLSVFDNRPAFYGHCGETESSQENLWNFGHGYPT